MLDPKNTQQVLSELSDEPFQVLGCPQQLQKEAQDCPIKLQASPHLNTILSPGQQEPLSPQKQESEEDKKHEVPSYQAETINSASFECWKSEDKKNQCGCQSAKKQQINLNQFQALPSEESTCIQVQFQEVQPKHMQEENSLQQKEQTKIQAKKQAKISESLQTFKDESKSLQSSFVPHSLTLEKPKQTVTSSVGLQKKQSQKIISEESQLPIVSKVIDLSKEAQVQPSQEIQVQLSQEQKMKEEKQEEKADSATQNVETKKSKRFIANLTFIWLVLCLWVLLMIIY